MKSYKLKLAFFLFFSFSLWGQSPKNLSEEFKDKSFVQLDGQNITSLEIVDDEILITNKFYSKTFVNDINVNGRGEVSLSYEPPFSEITKIDAFTLIPDFEKDKYHKQKVRDINDRKIIDYNVFHDGTRAKSFKFEGLVKGAVTVLEYEEEFREPFLVGREIFDRNRFSKKQHFSLVVENGIDINIKYFNCDSSFFEHWIEKKRKETIYHWQVSNLEAREWEYGSPSGLYTSPHILYRINSFVNSKNEVQNVLRNVSDLHKNYQRFLKPLSSPNSDLMRLTDSLIEDIKSPMEKARVIYDWVNHSIRYIAYEDGYGGFQPRDANLVYSKRYGDCKDMGNLIVQMMQYAGLNAHHVWIGTRDIPYTYEEVPTALADNHMIAALKLEGEFYFLDATNKFLPFPNPSSFIQGKQALINLGPDEFLLKTVPTLSPEQNAEIDSCFLKLKNTNLVGTGHKHYGVYHRSSVLRVLERKDEEALDAFLKSDLEKGDNRCKTVMTAIQTSDDGVNLDYTMQLSNYARKASDKLIINLNLEQVLSGNNVEVDRKNPLEFKNTVQFKRYFEIEIPEGMHVSFLPEGDSFGHEKFDFELNYSIQNNKVIYDLEISLKSIFIMPEDFAEWNKLIQKLRKNYQQTLIIEPNEI
tara:strand:- start:2767 stop:4686 length:1920 start_codon:yes stop_codon:yes gene_type:complete